jgi:lysophospholipase L1-like esterase
MRRIPSALINAALVFGSLTLFIAACEIGLRVTGIEKGRVMPPLIYQKSDNPLISYELKPNMTEKAFRSTVTTDSHGFRSEDIDPSKKTMAVLGDSITFGYGVENQETLPAQLQSLLPDYNVINAGVPGYNLTQERATYEEKIAPLKPEMLLLVFYWNDLTDTEPALLGDDGNLYQKGSKPAGSNCNPIQEGLMGLIPGKCWLDTHSAMYRVMKKLISRRIEKQNQARQEEEYRNNPSEEPVTQEQLQKYLTAFDQFASSLPPNLEKVFVIWPEKYPHVALRPELRTAAEAKGFRMIDLYDTFGNSAETLSWDTVHPSAKTLQEAAQTIHDVLR